MKASLPKQVKMCSVKRVHNTTSSHPSHCYVSYLPTIIMIDRPRRHDPSLNFLQFITLLSPLHPSAPRQVKLQGKPTLWDWEKGRLQIVRSQTYSLPPTTNYVLNMLYTHHPFNHTVLHMALDYRGDGKLTAREMSLLLKTLFTGRVSDRSIVMMGEDIMNALDESLQDCNDGEVSIAVVMCLIGRHDLDTRLTTYF